MDRRGETVEDLTVTHLRFVHVVSLFAFTFLHLRRDVIIKWSTSAFDARIFLSLSR